MSEQSFRLAGAELDWPIGSAPGLTNHPDINVVANRFEHLVSTGLSFVPLGSWSLGEARGGNGYALTETGWEYNGGDEYVDLENRKGYNAKALPSPGTDIGMVYLGDFVDLAASKNVETALSLSPHSGRPLEELKEIVRLAGKALIKKVLYVEANLSCPNVPGRPPFYQDVEVLEEFYKFLRSQDPLLNKYGEPGLYLKFGPYDDALANAFASDLPVGRITSNTKGNQEPKLPNGEPAIKVNNGRAGMSGPALRELGRCQLLYSNQVSKNVGTISGLGVDSGQEVVWRTNNHADAVQLGSVIYWPELIGCKSAAEAVEQIKQEIVSSVEKAD